MHANTNACKVGLCTQVIPFNTGNCTHASKSYEYCCSQITHTDTRGFKQNNINLRLTECYIRNQYIMDSETAILRHPSFVSEKYRNI